MQRVLSSAAGEWFCYGATVQDVSDTWTGQVIRRIGEIAYRDLRAIEAWAAEVRRHLERLQDGRSRWLVGQLGGAAGTASFWGERAPALQERFCRHCGLEPPDIAWVSARDRLADFGCLLAMVAHTLAKIGNEVLQLQRPELGELREPFQAGQVGVPVGERATKSPSWGSSRPSVPR